MSETTAARVWRALPDGLRDEADGHVLKDARMAAVRVLVIHGLSLFDAQLAVHQRYIDLDGRIERRPPTPLDLETLSSRAAAVPGRVVEIAAEWDGDTVHDWFVDLVARTAVPACDHRLATLTWTAATRHLGGEDPGGRHPSAVAAERIGTELAARLAVPFRFDHPDDPGHQPNTR
ncbi:hypothetical protein [Streptomyces sp. NPDC052225]|uniref:hypothetical protein n=1 Tax=Streptomyces sp. NPDC052225 TaxID=3154949 RepID=UPI00342A1A7D